MRETDETKYPGQTQTRDIVVCGWGLNPLATGVFQENS